MSLSINPYDKLIQTTVHFAVQGLSRNTYAARKLCLIQTYFNISVLVLPREIPRWTGARDKNTFSAVPLRDLMTSQRKTSHEISYLIDGDKPSHIDFRDVKKFKWLSNHNIFFKRLKIGQSNKFLWLLKSANGSEVAILLLLVDH